MQSQLVMGNVLEGATLLIVEDEAIIALEMKATLVEAGASVVGPAKDVAGALLIISGEKLSGAVLDVRLGAETVWPVAKALQEKKIPFVFHTAFVEKDIKESAWRDSAVLRKPASSRQLVNAMAGLLKH